MKKMSFLILLIFGLAFATTPVMADTLVVDSNPLDSYTNPQWVTPSDPADEGFWLSKLLGFTVPFISKDEDDNPLDDVPAAWTYAILKYGVGKPGFDNPDHWAIQDDGDFILELGDVGLSSERLSHVSYFGTQVPEPTTLLLLGLGLIGAAGIRRKLKG